MDLEILPRQSSQSFLKLRKKLIGLTGKAIMHFNMIEDSDRVMVCMSGGKDSYTMLTMLLALKKRAPINFDIVAVNLDQKQPNFPQDVLPNYFINYGIPYEIINEDTYSIVKSKIPEGKTTCSLCSRLRRGILYKTASRIGATKIALGHHKNDIVETFFLNMFHGSKLKSMPPKLLSDDKKNIIIRPLAFCEEKDIKSYANAMNFPIIPCDLCGSQKNLEREKIKSMLNNWEKDSPGRVNNIFGALSNIELSQLADKSLFDFESLKISSNSKENIELIRTINFMAQS
ncbi:tRNA 2-thiocytidine(32) synthetase TtcA [Methylophilaceae bacterium]|jgi:tRNA 2-thiocytidine biosynthesis protein TtcA|nr:tRNA 2-thiocytidine(32) synthetase TtcA [Methylophilaceae bacterium]|tara:strand:- start:1322 stop:2182 length:861 start_codon:yes stop_codon:yes gene_type:complete